MWLTVTGGALVAAAVARPRMAHVGSPAGVDTLDRALVDVASGALLVCALWLWVVTTVSGVEALRSAAGPAGQCAGAPTAPPSGVRRWVLVACGVAVVSGPLSPAVAGPGHHGPAVTALPYPDRAVAPHRRPDRNPRRHPDVAPRVVVRPGDSLWTIARRDLGAPATDAEVTLRWHRIYLANHRLIGPDPDLLQTGLRLLLPGKDPS